MSYDDEDDMQMELDDDSLTKNFGKMELKEYKDFKRPHFQLPQNKRIKCMNIDMTVSSKTVVNQQKQHQQIPFIKIYAVTQAGNSLQIQVGGFVPYFYTELPRNLPPDQTPQQLQQIRLKINARFAQLEKAKRRNFDRMPVNYNAIKSIEYVQKKNIRFYMPDEYALMKYWKISTSTPNVINPLRKMFEEETYVDDLQLPRQTFQSNIPYVLRFMIDKGIVGMGWMEIKNYKVVRKEEQCEDKEGNKIPPKCQLEIQCDAQDITPLPLQMIMPPLRIMSFDIECAAEHGFPDPEKHPIIQIACVCKTSTQKQEDYRVVFVLNGADKISGVHVKNSNDEKEILRNFEKLMVSYDPDFITGYNMVNFDLWYILERARALKMSNYGFFGRSKGVISRIKNGTFQSKVMGNRDTKQINIDGRIQLDMLIHMHREHKLSSYRLNNVAYQILNDQKEDVHHTEIFKLFKGGTDTRKRLAIYCVKDAELPLRLMEKLCCLFNYSEMARVTGVPINFLLNRGQQIKVMSQLLRKAKEQKYICPTERVKKNDNEIGYEGAFVLDPEIGFYDDPIATLDFASLYPSIMIAHNLCYTTLVRPDQLHRLKFKQGDIDKSPEDHFFVTKDVRQGLLPEILIELLAARKRAKNDLKKETDPMMRNVLEGRQLALKISANSVYGFTGALVGQLPCLQISSSVTGFGREMILHTKNKVQELYPGSKVIYGDTDSVMVKFQLHQSLQIQGTSHEIRTAKIKQAMDNGKRAAQQVTKALFDGMDPIKLQFEKVYCPYLLMAKKRYAGLYFSSNPQKHDKIDKKGIESVRRDNCVLIRRILQAVLKMILQENDYNGKQRAVEYIKEQVSLLVQNKIDISELVISKAITKKTGQQESDDDDGKKKDNKSKTSQNTYKVKQAHVELAEKMKKRDQNLNVSIGDRISYVMINGQKGSKNYDNAQNPLMVLNENLPIDYDYYINKQIKPPLERLLKKTHIIQNLDMLFCGQHTKNRFVPKIGKSNFFSKFVQKKQTCINCPTVTDFDLCQRCQSKRQQIYLKKQEEISKMQNQYKDYWQECVNCQGSNYNEILCKNQDCPIFYRRIKIRNDLEEKTKEFERVRWEW